MFLKNIFCFLGFFIIGFSVSALENPEIIPVQKEEQLVYDQSENLIPVVFDSDYIEKLKRDSDFDYSEKKIEENWWISFKKWINHLWLKFINWLVGDNPGSKFIDFTVRYLPYLIVTGILIFLTWLFFKLNPGSKWLDKQNENQLFFSEEDKIIKTQDISSLIEQALQEKNYRLAIRYHYLLILKKMDETGIISYQSDKTNNDYFSEIESGFINRNFKRITQLYDYIWYGNFEINQEEFTKALKTFDLLNTSLKHPN